MVRVLQAMAGAKYGGAEAFFLRLVTALHKAGLEQRVLLRPHADRVSVLRDSGMEVMELPFGGAFDFSTHFGFRRNVKEFAPDIVMSWMNRATRFVPPSKGRFVHVARLGGYYNLKYYRHCDHLIGNTRDIVDYLIKEGWPADRAHYLPNFVAAHRQPPVDRKALYTPNTAPLIVALGRLHPNKAFDTLLSALARVPDAYLWLAGEGPDRAALVKQAEDLGIKPRVRFLGWRDDVPALLAAADLFVCPSRHEPLGNVVLEAWAQGLPVVAADSLGPGTLIEHQHNGLLVPVDDVAAMAEAMEYVLEDATIAETLARNGHATFKAEFTEQAVVEQYLRFFRAITGGEVDAPKAVPATAVETEAQTAEGP